MAVSRVRASFMQCLRKSSRFKPFAVESETSSIRRFFSADSSASFQSVGFIGLGNMGSRMANNLIKAGYKMVVHDINRNTMEKYSDMGVATKETPFEVAEASDVVITMLPSPSHVLEVYNGSHGLLHGGYHLRPWLLIDSSTIDPRTSRELSAIVSSRILKEKRDSWENPVMLDAPVSGGVLAADAGTLTFMVGGPEESYNAAKTLFLSMGKSSVYCGGAGNGSAAKICNNLAMAVSMLGVSEALALGQSLGISAKTLTKVLNSSSARCWSSESYNPVPGVMEKVPSASDYDGGFASKLMAKDLNLAAASASEIGLEHPLTSQAQEIYKKLCEDGYENKDFSCVFRHFYSGDNEL
ncbi:probable 3-hydroxyisobutyrate dehydrogenase, mitochondrial isoform X1 [Cucurbita moschata]|uniref:3-hydroxyisobutyrate dehydrogenase n=2 Tax=Cucurbita moschata TaxID=3662 RepID=A0A6J1EHZ4_CUCMO|nr:probable 3-hydroxyisobutyrate dehydrogenase, mitochondrial isoform X1 [Cucurbita moschata]